MISLTQFGMILQADSASGGGFGSLGALIPFIAVFVILYFIMIRPEQKKQKAKEKRRKEMLANLQKADKIVTIGGIRGTVVSVKEKTVIVKVDDNTKMEFSREAISDLVDDKKDEDDSKKESDKDKSPKTE